MPYRSSRNVRRSATSGMRYRRLVNVVARHNGDMMRRQSIAAAEVSALVPMSGA